MRPFSIRRSGQCDRPPAGWVCKRGQGHKGPCAAQPSQTETAIGHPELLPCFGCAHSAAGEPFPSRPSGERPCCFCIRNPEGQHVDMLHPADDAPEPADERGRRYRERAAMGTRDDGVWYDGTPAFQTPMDCYISTDRLQQQRICDELNAIDRGEAEIQPRQEFPKPDGSGESVWCCEGGPAPGGHTWTCWGWLGLSFG